MSSSQSGSMKWHVFKNNFETTTAAYLQPCSRCNVSRRHSIVFRILCYLGDFDEIFLFFALCGLWTNWALYTTLILAFSQHTSHFDALSRSLAAIIWGIIALSAHYLYVGCLLPRKQAPRQSEIEDCPDIYPFYFRRHTNRRLKFGQLNPTSNYNAQTLLLEVLVLVFLATWHRETILLQNNAPYEDLFAECLPVDHSGSVYEWYSLTTSPRGQMLTVSQCDLARAIVNVSWVGPVGLLLATWVLLFSMISRPSQDDSCTGLEEGMSNSDVKEKAFAALADNCGHTAYHKIAMGPSGISSP